MTSANRRLRAALIALAILAAAPASATDRSLFLFGGIDHSEFLGCVTCFNSAAFSVWNPNSDYGSTTHENSIWNKNGKYGSRASLLSPWNPRAPNPPVVVDRAGNLYGYFTRNPNHPQRITQAPPPHAPQTEIEREGFRFLAWVLAEYDWIISHLDEARSYQSDS
jgi:hypothetical protein